MQPTPFTGGVEAGFNYQVGNVVYGFEVDYSYFHLSGSASGSQQYPCCAPTAFTINSSANTDWLFTARPRLGTAYGDKLFYVTGGLAVTKLNASFVFTDTFAAATESASLSGTKLGWTFGGGVEGGISGGWTWKAELLYVDFFNFSNLSGTSTNLRAFTPPIAFPTNVFTHSVSLQALIARVGLNYRFGGMY